MCIPEAIAKFLGDETEAGHDKHHSAYFSPPAGTCLCAGRTERTCMEWDGRGKNGGFGGRRMASL